MGLNYRQQRSLAESVDSVLDPQTNQAQLDEGYGSIREKASTRVGYQIKAAGDANMDLPDDVLDYVVNNIALSEKVMSMQEAYNEALRQLNSLTEQGMFGGGGMGPGGFGRPPRKPDRKPLDPDISPGAVAPKPTNYKQDPGFISDLKKLIKRGWKAIRGIGEDILDFILKTGKSLDDWLNENIIDPILSVFFEDLPADPEKQRVLRTALKIALMFLLRSIMGGGGGAPTGTGPGQGGPGSGGPLG